MLKSTLALLPFLLLAALPLAQAQQQGIPDKIGANVHRGPSMNALENKAKKSMAEGNYFQAMKYYQHMLDNDSLNVVALEGMADAAIAYTNYFKAEEIFEYMRRHELLKDDAASLLRQAKVKYLLSDYLTAKALYEQAGLQQDSDTVKKGIAACNWAMEHRDTINLDPVGKELNTGYAEYANFWDKDGAFYYSSYSKPYKGDSSRLLIQVLEARVRTDSSLDIRPSSFNESNKHTAYVCFNSDKTVLYYAIGAYEKDKPIRFDLYRRQRQADNWGPAEQLPAGINLPGISTTQPHVCRLPGAQHETLFFVSNRPGGRGGKDIWYARIEADTFSEPVNLFALNTGDDDVTPFFEDSTQTLFFSSNGRRPSLGGFDVYSASYQAGGWSEPEHLPEEINSSANDVFYSLYQLPHVAQIAFFSSNRYGAENFSEEECCYDVFKYRRPILYICNEEVGVALNNASITLYEETAAGPVEISRLTLPGATHPLPMLPGKSYLLITVKPGFYPDTFRFDT
ncbi:MAG: tetratricopeptide repeat protein, partial [Saprospiraceae bacterium]|nr:tetratricopeptide repeat protein [Saprospiraceae bacterium]